MEESSSDPFLSSAQVAGIYVVFGVCWVLLSDVVVFSRSLSKTMTARLELLEGIGFVAASGLLLFGLTRGSQRNLTELNSTLQQRTQQTHLLHRTLRHNLRNKCNIIEGHARLLDAECDADSVDVILQQTSELVDLSEKSHLIRDASLGDSSIESIDLVGTVERVLAELDRSPMTLDYRTDLPAEAAVLAHPGIEQAVRELVWNAHKHGEPPVEIRIDHTRTDVLLQVTDHGEGLPKVERTVLEEGVLETQTRHSRGLGLWLVHYLVAESDGGVSVSSRPDGTTTIELRFCPTEQTAINRLLH